MAYTLVYHPEVKARDVPALNRNVAKRIQRAIENRMTVEPQRYGEPLRRTLKGYWKLRAGDYRVVFRIVKTEIWIFAIMHRRDVYQRIEKRFRLFRRMGQRGSVWVEQHPSVKPSIAAF